MVELQEHMSSSSLQFPPSSIWKMMEQGNLTCSNLNMIHSTADCSPEYI